ncbi:hypothetical protein [Serratia liquefaciens]|uniref:hypothetical protein n=1 Tax=Serratia liquefaciens TaxID=614 RepID=UPI00374336C2
MSDLGENGTEHECDLGVHETALRASSIIDQLLAELEAMDKRIAELEVIATEYAGKFQKAQDALKYAAIMSDEDKKKIAELEKRLATPVRLPETLAEIGEKLRTQDNRITSEPMFCVYQKREIAADAECDHDRIVWVDEGGLEANERQRMRLELLHDNCREVPAKWRRAAVKEIDEFVTCCFTEQGCKDYLACNGHNLRMPFIYVKSGFRNAEYIALRNWLMTTGGFTVERDE